jgi:3-oxoacyl-(acyl-carrier-protein) synthase
VVRETLVTDQINCVAKASFGFGDVNSCLILKKYHHGSII